MNRIVMKRQMFNRGGGVQGLAMGGPPMGAPAGPPMGPPMGAPAGPPMGPEQALAGAEAQGQEMGMMAMDGVMQNIDGAQDYQSLIDGIRGNQQPLEARYAELGSIVGEQDAMQTPESVLALTQPAIMMTEEGAVNSGIGELMQGIAGDTSMEGQMGEGVGGLMMAQAPEPAMNDPMMEAGNTPPVNFRQGGPVEVRGYQDGKEVKAGGGQSLNPVITQAKRDASAYQDYFAGAMDSEARAADLEEQRKMSQAQMLFDIAQTGLQFAGNTQGGSIAERLANAAAQTQLPQRIGERSAQMLAAKQGQRAEDRQTRMAGLQASLQQSIADKTAADALALATAKQKPTAADRQTLYRVTADGKGLTGGFKTFDLTNVAERAAYDQASGSGNYRTKDTAGPLLEAFKGELVGLDLTKVVAKQPMQVDGVNYAVGEVAYLSKREQGEQRGKWDLIDAEVKLTTLYKKGQQPKTVLLGQPNSAETVEKLLSKGWNQSDIATQTAATIEIEQFKNKNRVSAAEKLAEVGLNLLEVREEGADRRQKVGLIATEEQNRAAFVYSQSLQDDQQLFTTGRDQTLQGYKKSLAADLAETNRAMQNLKNMQGRGVEQLRATLSERRDKAQAQLDQTNALEMFDVKSLHEIKVNTTEFDRKKEYAKYSDALRLVRETATEGRLELAAIRAEGRANNRTLDDESRALARLLAQELRAEAALNRELDKVSAMKEDTTINAEQRALARKLAQEKRDELGAIRGEIRNQGYDISAEKRLLITTIGSEERALGRDDALWAKNRSVQLSDIVAQTERELLEERRLRGYDLDDAAQQELYWKTRQKIENEYAIDAEQRALGRDLAKEDRVRIAERTRFERDVAAQIEKELRAVQNRDNIMVKEINGELVRVDKSTGEALAVYGTAKLPEPEYRVFTLPNANGVLTQTVADISGPRGKSLLDQVNQATEAGIGGASMKKVTTQSTAVRGFVIPNEGVVTSYDGVTYVDHAGEIKNLQDAEGVYEVNNSVANEVNKQEKYASTSIRKLQEIDAVLVQGMSVPTYDEAGNVNGTRMLDPNEAGQTVDAYAAARSGTGFWSKVGAGLNAVLSVIPGSEDAFRDYFKETTDARQFVKMVRVMGRSALSSSPRFAVSDLVTTEKLFPNEEALFSNPKTEADKLVTIDRYLTEEKQRLLGMFARNEPMDKATRTIYSQKISEIEKLQNILGPIVTTDQSAAAAVNFGAAQDMMRKNVTGGNKQSTAD